jgi:hypothetical protein
MKQLSGRRLSRPSLNVTNSALSPRLSGLTCARSSEASGAYAHNPLEYLTILLIRGDDVAKRGGKGHQGYEVMNCVTCQFYTNVTPLNLL